MADSNGEAHKATKATSTKGLSVARVLPLLEKYRGSAAAVGRALGVNRSTAWRFIQRHATLRDAAAEAREEYLDHCESALQVAALRSEPWAVIYSLKTLGRSRGYVQR